MKNQFLTLIVASFFIVNLPVLAQESWAELEFKKSNKIFRSKDPLPIRLRYSNKDLLRKTDDSTYLASDMAYMTSDGEWQTLEVQLRARGNWRRKNCFLAPIKMKIKKSQRKKTEFKGSKELKLVMPCKNNDQGHDYILKELIAYKMYELISPYHFKTRRLHIDLTDVRKKKEKEYDVLGFVIEDLGELTHRTRSEKIAAKRHPLTQNNLAAIRNDLFQFMIGNVDFSTYFQHNQKLIQVEKIGTVPVPYDFDMSGLVNASYAEVSKIQGEEIEIKDVTQRLYRGYMRDEGLYQQVRTEYLDKKVQIMALIEGFESDFYQAKAYKEAHAFIGDFFEILSDDDLFESMILNKARRPN